ncbi:MULTISPECIES: type IV pilus modification protein PilV [unclassified Pseudomonas]|uniref:type IV pilus modification protein PilV n=1 Tax=unclassified Pseudomonas TaxID=196821 RepID=UPI0007EE7253|nr:MULTISPECIES: type IV pilus modification protein PilV [unclassified Pseudomonas]MDU4251170.1 type IV pilus modification protein PilV [Pseudomonas sp.]OBY60041.1 type IV pilus modification protein PilV [Pseudomonas sp. AU12215]
MKSLHTQQGTTLIEILIAVVILAVGLLGMAGLQATSVQTNQGAYYRSQASILANDMADRMRANRDSAIAGNYTMSDFPASSSSNSVTGTRAEKDQAEWLNRLASALPSGTGKVALNANVITISVRWDDNRARIKATTDTTTPTETFEYRTRL